MIEIFTRSIQIADRTFTVNRLTERQQLRRAQKTLERLADSRTSDTAVVAGNGPSLAVTNRQLLRNTDLFISNNAFQDVDLWRQARALAIVNHLVAEQSAVELEAAFEASAGTAPALFVPTHLAATLQAIPELNCFRMASTPAFSASFSQGASCQSTVTYFLLQLTYWLGYRKVLLIGVDNSYQQKPTEEGSLLYQQGDDPNHFLPGYFRERYWHAADTDRMAATYVLALRAFEADRRTLLNCTSGGALESLPRADLSAALALPIETDSGGPSRLRAHLLTQRALLPASILSLAFATAIAATALLAKQYPLAALAYAVAMLALLSSILLPAFQQALLWRDRLEFEQLVLRERQRRYMEYP